MKKSIFVCFIILALIVSIIPASTALAKKDAEFVNIEVRNMTGAPISVIITDSLGLYSHLFTYEPGVWNLNIQKGQYTYMAATSCGVTEGSANFDRTKKLAFHCRPGAESSVYRAAPPCILRNSNFLRTRCSNLGNKQENLCCI